MVDNLLEKSPTSRKLFAWSFPTFLRCFSLVTSDLPSSYRSCFTHPLTPRVFMVFCTFFDTSFLGFLCVFFFLFFV